MKRAHADARDLHYRGSRNVRGSRGKGENLAGRRNRALAQKRWEMGALSGLHGVDFSAKHTAEHDIAPAGTAPSSRYIQSPVIMKRLENGAFGSWLGQIPGAAGGGP